MKMTKQSYEELETSLQDHICAFTLALEQRNAAINQNIELGVQINRLNLTVKSLQEQLSVLEPKEK